MNERLRKQLEKLEDQVNPHSQTEGWKPLGPDSTYPKSKEKPNERHTQHTPTPWIVKNPKIPVGCDKEGDRLICSEETKEHVAEVFQYRNDNHKDEATGLANAEFIVLACNAYDDLLAALEDLVWISGRGVETEDDWFERNAERFERETGMLAPGKDQAAALCGTPSHEEREAAYQEWLAGFVARARAAIAKAKGEQERTWAAQHEKFFNAKTKKKN